MYISKELFMSYICDGVKERLGPDFSVDVIESFKSNDRPCHHLIAYKDKAIGCPAIVLEDAYNHYRHGIRLDDICDLIAAAIKDDDALKALDTSWYLDYDKACNHICYKLINRERNEEYLKDKPFVPYLDLAIVFYAPIIQDKKLVGIITVTDQHLQAWNVTVDDLMNAATDNSTEDFPSVFLNAAQVYRTSRKKHYPKLDLPDHAMYICTNLHFLYGASVILYDFYLERVYDTFGTDFYLAFSSVHEAVVWIAYDDLNVDEMQKMIKSINAKIVDPEEVLSDHLYKYDHASGELTIYR